MTNGLQSTICALIWGPHWPKDTLTTIPFRVPGMLGDSASKTELGKTTHVSKSTVLRSKSKMMKSLFVKSKKKSPPNRS